MNWKEAWDNVGGLSKPSKMPCYSWSISAKKCKVGSSLAKNPLSVCSSCYALKGRYVFPNVQQAQDRRLAAFLSNPVLWYQSMSFLIKHFKQAHFRWFDSGDLQSVEMLDYINMVALENPQCKFWLPTKEYRIVKDYVAKNSLADNLVIRLSAYRVKAHLQREFIVNSFTSGNIVASSVDSDGWNCPSHLQENKCGTCRKCWDKNEFDITYRLH